ncbi:MAG: outer membrane lipid asymmetry maintenance protein MlaD [Ectothiorhodospiraceae bacterium]|nr:outer membrane lipid asymmetry maintenance protein MlaD [Ectothiorhodospiraceae bacterium]
MAKQRIIEIWVGLFVAAGFAALFGLAMQVSNIPVFQTTEGYDVYLRFENVGGLRPRAPVTMSGVRVGRVKSIELDENTYQALVTITIESRFDRIPEDTSASIFTSGLLGEQYIALDPGGTDWFLEAGDEIALTQGALVLERLIGRFLTSMGQDDN